MGPPLSTPRLLHIARGAAWALVAFLLGMTLFVKQGRIDLEIVLRAADRLRVGLPLYDLSEPLEHTKAPLLTLPFIPLAWLGPWAAGRLWDLLNLIAYPALLVWLARRLPLTQRVRSSDLVLGTLLLTLNPWNTELWTGQFNALLMWGVLGAALLPSAFWAGALLAPTLLFKPPLFLLLPWLARLRPLSPSFFLGGVTTLGLLMAAFVLGLGWDPFVAHHRDWLHFLPLSSAKHLSQTLNYGLPSLLRSLPHASETSLLLGLVLAEWICRREKDVWVAFSLVSLIAVMASPMAWFQNYVVVCGLCLLCLSDFVDAPRPGSRLWMGLALALLFVSFPLLNPEVLKQTRWGPMFYTGNRIPFWGTLGAMALWLGHRAWSRRALRIAYS